MNEMLTLIASFSGLFIAGANATFWAICKFNDMKHLQADLKEIKESISCIDKKMYINAEKIGVIEGRCSSNHPS